MPAGLRADHREIRIHVEHARMGVTEETDAAQPRRADSAHGALGRVDHARRCDTYAETRGKLNPTQWSYIVRSWVKV